VRLDLAELPRRGRVVLGFGRAARERIVVVGAGEIRARDVAVVWWRPPRPLVADRRLGAASAAFAVRQMAEALLGLASTLDARWVNDPWREAVAARKPHQLAAAERVGLRVPRTLVTNDPTRARRFVGARGPSRTVHKALDATPEDWQPTRLVAPEDVRRIGEIRHAPVVLQEYVPGVDVRVTIAGRVLFATEIDARATPSPEDFRPAFATARVTPCTLPPDVTRRLRALVAELGLRFAAIDLRRRGDGEHVFLEVNPSGQWLFLEERTGQPITEAVARLLASR
jgi:glutathione synthase/RimK-type ligase-like ATP-grasp enzyme